MTYYSVMEVTPTEESWISTYLAKTGVIVKRYGGEYLARTANHERLEGDGEDAAVRIIISWPSREAAMSCMNDSDYAAQVKARLAGSISHHFLIEGIDDLTDGDH